MSMLAKLNELPADGQRQVQILYGEQFPLDLRCAIADWVECQPWQDLDADSIANEHIINSVVPSIVQEITRVATITPELTTRFRLQQCVDFIQSSYSNNPFMLVRVINQCLQGEQRIIQQYENVSDKCLHFSKSASHFLRKLFSRCPCCV